MLNYQRVIVLDSIPARRLASISSFQQRGSGDILIGVVPIERGLSHLPSGYD